MATPSELELIRRLENLRKLKVLLENASDKDLSGPLLGDLRDELKKASLALKAVMNDG